MQVRSAGVLVGLVLLAVRGEAQSAPVPPGRVCDMSAKVVTMRLVDSRNAGVGGATISVRRARTRTTLPAPAAMGTGGDYLILEDGQLSDLRAAGEPFEVTFRKDGRVVRHRLVIGMDAAQCHIDVKRGALVARM